MFNPVVIVAGNPGPMTGTGNRTYLVAAPGREATLVDAGVGLPRHLEAIAAALAEADASLSAIVATHGHSDHVAGAPAVLAAHPGAVCRKYPWPEQDGRFAVAWTALADGQRVAAGDTELVVVHTPGHSPDHCALWHVESATVFTGDLIMPGGSVIIQTSRGGDLRQYLASLDLLLTLGARVMLPAHGPAINDPESAVRSCIRHRLQRERQVLLALAAGPATVPDIAESIYHGLPPVLIAAARENVLAHLEKLRHEGRAAEADGRWQA